MKFLLTTLLSLILLGGTVNAVPGQTLNLTGWKLKLPTDTSLPGAPDEVRQPTLNTFTNEYFYSGQGGVVFRTPANGYTTSGSSYPRTELGEAQASGTTASWSNTSGKHTLTVIEAVTHLPDVKKDVTVAQIHGGSDDLVTITLRGNQLQALADGQLLATLDSDYQLGRVFEIDLIASNGEVRIYHNNVRKATYKKTSSTNYFKAGSYCLTNLSKGDTAASYCEVVIYDLRVRHE